MELIRDEQLGEANRRLTFTNEDGDIIIVNQFDEKKFRECLVPLMGNAKSNNMWHVASIPMSVVNDIHKKTGLDLLTCDPEERRKWLNDPDNAVFRVTECKL